MHTHFEITDPRCSWHNCICGAMNIINQFDWRQFNRSCDVLDETKIYAIVSISMEVDGIFSIENWYNDHIWYGVCLAAFFFLSNLFHRNYSPICGLMLLFT